MLNHTHTRCLSFFLSLCMVAATIESDSGNLVQFVVNLPLMTPGAGWIKEPWVWKWRCVPHLPALSICSYACFYLFCIPPPQAGSCLIRTASLSPLVTGSSVTCSWATASAWTWKSHTDMEFGKWKSIMPCTRQVAQGGKVIYIAHHPPRLCTSAPLPLPPPLQSICLHTAKPPPLNHMTQKGKKQSVFEFHPIPLFFLFSIPPFSHQEKTYSSLCHSRCHPSARLWS